MSETSGTAFRPESAEGVREVVAWAAAEERPLEVLGHGTKRTVGRPVQAEHALDLTSLTGVTLYEPEELVLSARAGTPIAQIEALLAGRGQELPFEPMDHGPLGGGAAGRGTVGGVVAANVGGPRRIKAGAARDHVLGVAAVSGRGEIFKAGGRVVKNVTGYDLSRGLAGSWGTLAVLTDVTLKVLPRAEAATTLVLERLADDDAVRALAAAMGSPYEVSGAAHLPAGLAGDLPGLGHGRAATLIRLEGFEPSVAYRAERLAGLFADVAPAERVSGEASAALWRAVRDAMPFAASARPLWRVSVAPTAGPAVVSALAGRSVRHFYDWSGGLVWIEVPDEADDACAGLIRTAIEAAGGGHATLVRGSAALRTAVPPFQPQPAALAALSRRLKEQFDPNGILNPGRMAAGQ
ncbi:glycolate oxidase subunit GlcE [Faunimonas sp. B44]|uniref:glycolate oxidase subunit GlcE n=1 Tax=Faunimonas sp. B44 TaxID=3461493 RepID=UPI004044D4C8